MPPDASDRLVRARRAYELGRARLALTSAVLVAGLVALLAWSVGETQALRWLPVTFVVWAVLYWLGREWFEGGRLGALAGSLTLVLPASILRPCCKPGMDMATMGVDCCTRPELCVASGAAVGLLLALSLPTRGGSSMSRRVLGAAAGVFGVASLRCAALFWGETVGLLGGIALGLVVASAVRSALRRFAVRA